MRTVVAIASLTACVEETFMSSGDDQTQETDTGGELAVVAQLSAGDSHSCALLEDGAVRCWGAGADGRLGYGSTNDVGDDEAPATAGDVDVGGVVVEVGTGWAHTCARLESASVRCWGLGLDGQLGYANTNSVGDDETPNTAGDLDIGAVEQLAVGGLHTCARLEAGRVRCWGAGGDGRLGYANTESIGDDETPASAGDVDVGGVVAELVAGWAHTCARLEGGGVRCWGSSEFGQLGYGSTESIGDDETPSSVGDVDVGGTVVELAAGVFHTCARLDDGAVRCWGSGNNGQLGYASTGWVGESEGDTPATAGDVDVGGVVVELAAGGFHTCARLDTGAVRCWGWGEYGQLGYANIESIGDDENPATAGDVDLGGSAVELTVGWAHTCALLTTGGVRCWGWGDSGRLGYANTNRIGDDETPESAGDVWVVEP